MTTQTFTDTLVVLECGGCHVTFGMSKTMYNDRRQDHKSWWCPNGCCRAFLGKSEAEKLREQVTATEQSLDAARSLARREAERRQRAERQRSAARGQVTKIKRRVGRGVCPCCNRTFADLGRHMAGQHPDFADGTP